MSSPPDRSQIRDWQELVVSADDLLDIGHEILSVCGAPDSHAEVQTRVLVEADLRGQHSHGVQRLRVLVDRIRAGVLDPAAEPELSTPTTAALRIDGMRAFGPVAAFTAVDALLERAPRTGVASASIHNANHLGMLAPYVERLADSGMIAMAMTTSEALVHPWGGTEAMVGTNPIAIAVPADGGQSPLVVDMSTAQVSAGRILDHAVRGASIPLGWAVDADGNPTTDATEARVGALSPFGGPKGYALAVAIEVVVARLTGTSLGTEVRGTLDTDKPSTKGDVLIAFAPESLGVRNADVAGYLGQLRATVPRDAGRPVVVPGDRARLTRDQRLRGGIPLPTTVWKATVALRDQLRRAE